MTTLRLCFVPAALLVAACQGPATEGAGLAAAVARRSRLPMLTPASSPSMTSRPVRAVRCRRPWRPLRSRSPTNRPVARGRELFGGIVAYGEIWNPGANDATKINISRPIRINGSSLEAGAYSIWAIPDPNEWTVIFSRAADVYHTPYPGEEHDALRLMVAPRQGDHMETLAFYFATVEKKGTELRLHWGQTVIPFHITVP